MAKWMNVLLAGGVLPTAPGSSPSARSRQLTSIVTPLSPTANPPPELAPLRNNFAGYALGLNVRDYRGMTDVDAHRRAARLRLARDDDARREAGRGGADQPGVGRGLRRDRLPRGRPLPRRARRRTGSRAFARRRRASEAQMAEAEKKAASARDAASKPSLPLERYAATYEDAWYGDIAITLEQGKLVMRFSHTPSLVGDLEHWQHDTFVVALARSGAARRRLRDLRAEPRRHHRPGEDAGRLGEHRLQLRLPGSAADSQATQGLKTRRAAYGRKTRMCCQGSTSMTRSKR